MIVKDSEASEKLVPTIISLAKDEKKQAELKSNVSKLAITNADDMIAKEILKAVGA
jgi:UDP-N-acetylglucosamine--N-acetylmuramyl-(pentapeptide) pyrophosphoryl-undecaprenol N-acetylglucosamine transferase